MPHGKIVLDFHRPDLQKARDEFLKALLLWIYDHAGVKEKENDPMTEGEVMGAILSGLIGVAETVAKEFNFTFSATDPRWTWMKP